MKMRKLLCILLTLVMVIGLFAGCGKKDEDKKPEDNKVEDEKEPEGEKEPEKEEDDKYWNGLSKKDEVTLKIAIADVGNGTAHMDATIEIFEKAYPNVKIEATRSADIGTIVDAKMQAGDEDMFNIFGGCSYSQVEMIQNGLVECTDDLWDHLSHDTEGKTLKELTFEDWVDWSYVGGWEDGEKHVANFPSAGGGYIGLYYNKNLFEKNGWNEAPQTWDEFVELCKEIKADGVWPLVSTGVHNYYVNMAVGDYKVFELAAADGKLDAFLEAFREGGSDEYPIWNNKYKVEVWEKMSWLGAQGYYHDGAAGMNHTQAQMQVVNESAAMVPTGSWVSNEMKDATDDDFVWGYMVLPMRPNTDSPMVVGTSGNQAQYIYAKKSDLEIAWSREFMVCMWDMEAQIAAAEVGTVSIRSDFAEDADRVALYDDSIAASAAYLAANDVKVVNSWQNIAFSGTSKAQADTLYSTNLIEMCCGHVEDVKGLLDECQEFYDVDFKAFQAEQNK